MRESRYLKKIPDLTTATSLEELDLHGCISLLELTSTIAFATKLTRCKLGDCFRLKELPSSMGRLINLEVLYMTGCRNLNEFPNVPDSIEELVLSKTRIKKIPPLIVNLSRLRRLIMCGCKKLKKISRNVSKLENLQYLDLSNSDNLNNGFKAVIRWEGPDSKRRWELRSDFKVHYLLPRCLPTKKALSVYLGSYSRLKTIPDCIIRLSGLIKLCPYLVTLPPLPDSLIYI